MKKSILLLAVVALLPLKAFAEALDKADCVAIKVMIANQEKGMINSPMRSQRVATARSSDMTPDQLKEAQDEEDRINKKLEQEEKAAQQEEEEANEKILATVSAMRAVYKQNGCDEQFLNLNEQIKQELPKHKVKTQKLPQKK